MSGEVTSSGDSEPEKPLSKAELVKKMAEAFVDMSPEDGDKIVEAFDPERGGKGPRKGRKRD